MKEVFSEDKSNFVNLKEEIPDIVVDLRYHSNYNFVGTKIDGYEKSIAYVTKECAKKLKEVNDEVKKYGYVLKIFDAYRPQMAVNHFIRWGEEKDHTKTKDIFYNNIEKENLFKEGYISKKSAHTRGSTVDLTLYNTIIKEDLDTGGEFDNFGEIANYNYQNITEFQKQNRKYLRDVMVRHGFIPLETEWWHFTLKNEPYPNTYFTFEIK